MMWSKVKHLIRKAKARFKKTLHQAIGKSLCVVTEQELANDFPD